MANCPNCRGSDVAELDDDVLACAVCGAFKQNARGEYTPTEIQPEPQPEPTGGQHDDTEKTTPDAIEEKTNDIPPVADVDTKDGDTGSAFFDLEIERF